MADYKSKTDKGECIFCKIISGEIKTPGIFWENDEFMAFLSTWPNTEGFTVVVPKEHYGSDVLGMLDDKLSKFVLAAKTVSKNLIAHFKDVGRVGLIMEGTGIDHAHIKLFPMHGTGHMKKGKWKQYHSNNENFFETYEGYISSNDGPKGDEQKIRELAEKLREIK
jgi:diadenosine tetraphosphate (Ap4A) HIT family hydrolase